MTGIASTTIKIGVIGLGYVTLPSAAGFAELDITDIETGNDRCEARHAGLTFVKGQWSSKAQRRATHTSRPWRVS